MNLSEYYGTLSAATLVVAALTVLVWVKTREIAFVLGCGFLYYWSLYGAWNVIARNGGSPDDFRFEYMYKKLFPVYLDADYISTLLLYTLFIICAQLTLVILVRKSTPFVLPPPLRLDHRLLLLAGASMGLLAVWTVRDVLSLAHAMSASPYVIVGAIQSGSNPGFRLPLFSLYQLLNEASLGCLAIGFAVLLSGRGAKYIAGRQGAGAWAGYVVILGSMIFLNIWMGNRSAMIFALLPGGLFYLANAKTRNTRLIVGGAAVSALVVLAPGVMRSAAAMRDMSQQRVQAR